MQCVMEDSDAQVDGEAEVGAGRWLAQGGLLSGNKFNNAVVFQHVVLYPKG